MGVPAEQYQIVLSSLIDGVLLISADQNIAMGNHAIEEMFRQSQDMLSGKPLSDLFPNQPLVNEKLQKTLDTGSAFRDVECAGYRKSNQTHFQANLTFSPVLNAQGEIEGAVILVKDVTLLRNLQESFQHSEHMSSMGILAAGLAHEIKNPLGGIRGAAQLLLLELSKPDQGEYLNVVIAEVDRINRMVENMLDFTRPQQLQQEQLNIHQILEHILILEKESLTVKKGTVIQEYDPSLPQLVGEEDRLKQVFLNLIKNAVEAIPEGGAVRLVTRVGTDYSVKTGPDSNPCLTIIIEIIDSGPGIPAEELKKLFTPFYTTKRKGSGLGLPLSLKIIEDHGGTIKVLSEMGKGTTVQVFLPVLQTKDF